MNTPLDIWAICGAFAEFSEFADVPEDDEGIRYNDPAEFATGRKPLLSKRL